jgi:hypothetical protein
MSHLCSVLFPSRARFDKCVKSIESIIAAAGAREDFDILIRCDNDDPQKAEYEKLPAMFLPVQLFWGDRGVGYNHLGKFFAELASYTDATWLQVWNDDATLKGPWLPELEKVPTTGFFAQCQIHRLGGSTYAGDDCAPFVYLPNGFWDVVGWPKYFFPHNPDTGTILALKEKGWTVAWLMACSFHHVRDENDVLEAHRKL